MLICLVASQNAAQLLEEEELLLFHVKATPRDVQKSTNTPNSTKTTVAVTSTTEGSATTTERDFDYPTFEPMNLKPVKGLKKCLGNPPPKCASLCGTLKVMYDYSNASPINTASWILIVIFVALLIITAVLFVKWREMRKGNYGEREVNLSNVKKKSMERRKVTPEHARQDNIDANPSKFPNKGNITIATNLDEAFKQKNEDENEVDLENVEYDEHGNEQFDIGDDLDKFETNGSDKSGSKMVKSKVVNSDKSKRVT